MVFPTNCSQEEDNGSSVEGAATGKVVYSRPSIGEKVTGHEFSQATNESCSSAESLDRKSGKEKLSSFVLFKSGSKSKPRNFNSFPPKNLQMLEEKDFDEFPVPVTQGMHIDDGSNCSEEEDEIDASDDLDDSEQEDQQTEEKMIMPFPRGSNRWKANELKEI